MIMFGWKLKGQDGNVRYCLLRKTAGDIFPPPFTEFACLFWHLMMYVNTYVFLQNLFFLQRQGGGGVGT